MTAVDLFNNRGPKARSADEVYTPDWCAADMVRHFSPAGRILEPCRGGGAFMRYLPPDAMWCEIAEGRDFFAWNDPVDWIITNPPFSITHAFLRHAISVASEIVFLVPVRNLFSGYAKIRECSGWGGLSAIRWYGPGSRLGFPMGNPIAALQWSRGKKGIVRETFYDDEK